MEKSVIAIIQARMGSARLPGKTLADIAGKPLLAHVIERVRACRSVQRIVVATTAEPIDKAIVSLSRKWGAESYTGSTDDVLDRYYQAAQATEADVIARITADDPFKDPDVIDEVVERLLGEPGLDYASNTLEPTYPEGLDAEVFTFKALSRAWEEATLPSDREHVTPYMWRQPERFQIANVRRWPDLSGLRWTIDYERDLEFTREVYARLYTGRVFRMEEILALLEAEPELAQINQGIMRNAGYLGSLEKESGAQPWSE